MTPPHIEAIARALEGIECGYSLNLTRFVDGESTYVLTYSDGSPPIEFSDADSAYEHIAHKRTVSRATLAFNMSAEICAKVAEWAHMVPPDGGSPSEEECEVARGAAKRIRALSVEQPRPSPSSEE